MTNSIIYESQSRNAILNPEPIQLDNLLSELDGKLNSFASLTHSSGTYIQVGGGPECFVVEHRLIHSSGSFSHRRAASKRKNGGRAFATIGTARVVVRQDELLSLTLVKKLFRSFLKSLEFSNLTDWNDISEMFQ